MIKLAVAIVGMVLLSGCTVTGEPRSKNVVFDEEGYTVNTETYKNSISVGNVENFPGTSPFWVMGKLAPNFSDKSFKSVLKDSLMNADLHGDDYVLNARLIDSGDWSESMFSTSWGTKSRRIEIEYTLNKEGEQVFQDVVVSDIAIKNNPIVGFYITQRGTAEVNYAENIRLLIEEINKL